MDELLEYSVVYTDRALNHMSGTFQGVMRDISATLCQVYNSAAAVVVPGSGTFGMESVARQFADGEDVLVVRNGWFSFRWSQIFDAGGFASSVDVMAAAPDSDAVDAQFSPAALADVQARIRETKPAVVFAPHVETSAGLMLPDDYIAGLADAVHEVGGLLVIDCIASGTIWLDMAVLGIDVLISAPQKGWSGPPCCGLVMMSEAAVARCRETESSSFAMNLRQWLDIMDAYLNGGHAYHATMPTESLRVFRDVMQETVAFGVSEVKAAQVELGTRIRGVLAERGIRSVAAPGFEAPGVVVSHTGVATMKSGAAFAAEGMQIAGGVPLRCGEHEDFSTFRLGLFGLDKLGDIDAAVGRFEQTLDRVLAEVD